MRVLLKFLDSCSAKLRDQILDELAIDNNIVRPIPLFDISDCSNQELMYIYQCEIPEATTADKVLRFLAVHKGIEYVEIEPTRKLIL